MPEDDFPEGIDRMELGDRIVLLRDTDGFAAGTEGTLVGPPEGLHISVNGVLGEVLIDGDAEPTVLCEADFRPKTIR